MAIETPTQFLSTFAKGFVGQVPIYRLGKQIGYYIRSEQGEAELCKGTIMLYEGQEKSDPKTWYTKNGWWKDVPVTEWCLQLGKPPAWLTPEQKASAVQAPTGAIVVPGLNDKAMSAGGISLPVLIGGGAVGLAVLLLLVRR